MRDFVFAPPPQAAIDLDASGRYPVRRIFCVGRNYAEHAAEMGDVPDREAPFFFTKAPAALRASGGTMPYPCGTADLHYEMELVAALGAELFRAAPEAAGRVVMALGAGLDMTRRDLQQQGKDKRRPWDFGKDFEGSAVVAPLRRVDPGEDISGWPIRLDVDGTVRQSARIGDMIHALPGILSYLSGFYHLGPGDIVFTGTPAGVGAVGPGARLVGSVGPLAPVELTIGSAE